MPKGRDSSIEAEGRPRESVRFARPTTQFRPVRSIRIASNTCSTPSAGHALHPLSILDTNITTDYNHQPTPTSAEGTAGSLQREFC
jgi:hypothetical protein